VRPLTGGWGRRRHDLEWGRYCHLGTSLSATLPAALTSLPLPACQPTQSPLTIPPTPLFRKSSLHCTSATRPSWLAGLPALQKRPPPPPPLPHHEGGRTADGCPISHPAAEGNKTLSVIWPKAPTDRRTPNIAKQKKNQRPSCISFCFFSGPSRVSVNSLARLGSSSLRPQTLIFPALPPLPPLPESYSSYYSLSATLPQISSPAAPPPKTISSPAH